MMDTGALTLSAERSARLGRVCDQLKSSLTGYTNISTASYWVAQLGPQELGLFYFYGNPAIDWKEGLRKAKNTLILAQHLKKRTEPIAFAQRRASTR